jgi:hypothetical protein
MKLRRNDKGLQFEINGTVKECLSNKSRKLLVSNRGSTLEFSVHLAILGPKHMLGFPKHANCATGVGEP